MFDITISVNYWVGLFIFGVIVLIIILTLLRHVKAKNKVREAVLRGDIEFLIEAIKDVKMQEEALDALGKTKDPRAVDALINFVNSKEVREDEEGFALALGLQALGETENPKAIEFLISLLHDESWFVRCFACPPLASLAQRGIKVYTAVEPLIELMKDTVNMRKQKHPDLVPEFEDYVREALTTITGNNFKSDVDKWEKWWQENKDFYLSQNVM